VGQVASHPSPAERVCLQFINHFLYNTVCPANLDWSDMNDGVVFCPKLRNAFTERAPPARADPAAAELVHVPRKRTACASWCVRALCGSRRPLISRPQCDALNLAIRNGHQDMTRLVYDHEVALNDTITTALRCSGQCGPVDGQ